MEKQIGKYKIKFLGKFSDKTDKLTLNIAMDGSLTKFLNTCISAKGLSEQKIKVALGRDELGVQQFQEFERYLIKTPLAGSINYIDYSGFVFIKEFVQKGKVSIEFNDFEKRDQIKNSVKKTIKALLQQMNDGDVNETVVLDVKE